ncbi:MAG: helicase SNF2 [Clostridia bacterium]|nr:helicase SNF2 [Clostridia bacterium]
MNRYSSRRYKLDKQFLVEKLKNAESYDRIAGYFCSSILEVAGESIENVDGKVRVICNSRLLPEDIAVANHAQKMKQEWCEFSPEEKYTSPESSSRLSTLYRLLNNGKLEIRVIPDQIFGLMHGKAGVITYKDGSKTSFLGSINETKSAYTLNYEMLWEDDSEESVKWVQDEFNFFWNSQYAVNLSDFIVNDLNRISKRIVIGLKDWRENSDDVVPSAAVEEPVYRKEFGLWEHQKYFVELAFREHKKDGGARYLLADQVGLGKTLQLAMSAKLMALYGDKPVLIIVPKTLVWQWQDEMNTLLDMPSAVWIGSGWQDESGYFYQADSVRSILKCPRRVGIISQGLVSRKTEAAELLSQKDFECVILDEAHRARRRNPTKDPNKHKADSNYLLHFLNAITFKTKSLLLATATPVQINPIEAFDLINALSLPTFKVMGDMYSEWHKKPQLMLDMVCGKEPYPESEITMWDIIRNPLPTKTPSAQDRVNRIRDKLDISDKTYVLPAEYYSSLLNSKKDNLRTLYTTDEFIANYNPYIRHIVRRTRDFLENTMNPASGETYLKKIVVELYGEGDDGAIPLEGYLRQAYSKAQEFCSLLSSRVKAGGFMSTLILKRIGSTIIAGDNTARKMLAWTEAGKEILKDEFDVTFEEDDDFEENVSEVKNLTDEETECLRELVKMLSLNHDNDPKYIKVLDILNNGTDESDKPWKGSGCIVFSQYYDSAYFVAEKLSKDLSDDVIGLYAGGDKSGYFINGSFHKDSKDNIKGKVKNHEIKILVGTDAASEGLNLQTLSTLINLDLPWNPTRLEQRKGRIQRIGQVAPKVKIFNMRYKDSVEDKVHTVLSDRLKNIKDMFGQIPDTLEDIWIDVALNDIEKAKERIDIVPEKNPFTIKYETKLPKTENWEACSVVLDNDEKLKQLMNGW